MSLWVFYDVIELGPVIAADLIWLAGTMLMLSCFLQLNVSECLAWRGLLGWCFIISAYLLRHGILRAVMIGSLDGPEFSNELRIISMTHAATRTFIIPMVLTLCLLGSVWIRWLRGRAINTPRLAITAALLLMTAVAYFLLVWFLWQGTDIEGGVLQERSLRAGSLSGVALVDSRVRARVRRRVQSPIIDHR